MSLTRARELRQERAKAITEARDTVKEAGDQPLSAEAEAKYQRLMDRASELKAEYEKIEEREQALLEAEKDIESIPEPRAGREAFAAEDRGNDRENLKETHNRQFERWVRSLASDDEHERREAHRELRATGQQIKGQVAQGGNLVPDDFRAQVVEQLKAFGGMRRSRATVITTDNGRNLDVPTVDDTANQAAIVGEASTFASTHVPFGQVTLEAVKYGVILQVSSELLQDSAVPVVPILRDMIAKRFGRVTEDHYAQRSSTESVGPHGLVTASTGGAVVLSPGSSNITPESLKDLIYAVDPAYRVNGEWMISDEIEKAIAKLRVGSSDQFLWQPSFVAGVPDRLLGYPVVRNLSFSQPSTTTGSEPIWFGDFSHYWIRDVNDMAIRVLNERYAERDLIGLVAFMRTDGRPVLATSTAARKPFRSIEFST